MILPPVRRGLPGSARKRARDRADLKVVARTLPAEDMTMWPVSARVGNVRNNDPLLIEQSS
jgi:putative SOS response-associated peptidase YedK